MPCKKEAVGTFFLALSLGLFTLSLYPGLGAFFFAAFLASLSLSAFFYSKKHGKKGLFWLVNFFKNLFPPFAIALFLGLVIPLALGLFGVNVSNMAPFFESPAALKQAILFLALAPFIEETVFRGFALNFSKKAFGHFSVPRAKEIAVALSALAFSLAHSLPSPLFSGQLVFFSLLFAIGVLFGLHFLKHGLVSVAWLHGLYNFTAFALTIAFF